MSSSTVESRMALATAVKVSEDTLSVELADGRTIAAPLAWYPRLAHATAEERNSWRLIARGQGIHWPAIDEDISVANLLAGQPSAESQSSLEKWLAGRAKASPSRRRSRAFDDQGLAGDEGAVGGVITGERGRYVLLVGPPLVPSPRYVHFSWGGRAGPLSFKLRDYIGGILFQHPGATPQPEDDFRIVECPMGRDEVWAAAQRHIPARGELLHKVRDFPWWRKKLTEMGE
jgi:Protein of unknown function (DUF2442)